MPELEPHLDLGGYVLDTIDEAERNAFEEHLLVCEQCQLEVQELTDLKTVLSELAANPIPPAPSGVREQTMDAVGQVLGNPRDRSPASRRPLLAVLLLAVFVLAAAVLVAVAVAVVVSRNDDRSTVGMALVDVGTRSVVGEVIVRPGSAGRVVDLRIDQMAPSGIDDHYECWFVAEVGDSFEHPNRVSAGTFSVDESGRATVRLSAQAGGAYPFVAVTREPSDGDPRRTGPNVVVSSTDLP